MHPAIPRPESGELDRELAGPLRSGVERLSMRRGNERDWITEKEALNPHNAVCLSAKHATVQRFALALIEAPAALSRPCPQSSKTDSDSEAENSRRQQ